MKGADVHNNIGIKNYVNRWMIFRFFLCLRFFFFVQNLSCECLDFFFFWYKQFSSFLLKKKEKKTSRVELLKGIIVVCFLYLSWNNEYNGTAHRKLCHRRRWVSDCIFIWLRKKKLSTFFLRKFDIFYLS